MKHLIRLHRYFWLGLLGLALSTPTLAASYKWTDSKGNVHYSQHPPTGKSYEKIKTPKKHRPSSSSAATPAASSSGTGSSKISTANGDEVLKKERANNAEIRKKNCEQSKHNLKAFTNFRRIKDPDGTVRPIPDQERTERIKQAEQGIKEFCG